MNNKDYIYLSHILFGGPLLTYVGYMKQNTHNNIYKLLLITSIIVILYHLYQLYTKYTKNKYISYVNLVHLILVAPLLLYVSIYKSKVVYPISDLLFVLGVGMTILFLIKYIQ